MSGRTPTWVLPGMLAGVILGGLLGFYLPDTMLALSFVGKLFANALRMLVIPLVVGTLIVGIGQLADNRRLGQISGLAIIYYLATTLVAVLLAVVTVSLLKPGAGAAVVGLDSLPNLPSTSGRSLAGILTDILPENVVRSVIEGEYLGIAIFTGLFALALTWLASRGRSVITFFGEVNDALIRLLTLVMYAAPVGVLFLFGGAVANGRGSVTEILGHLGMYLITVVAVLLVLGAVIFPLVMMALTKRNVGSYLNNMSTALTAAFATSSSAAAFPLTYDAVTDSNRVDSKPASVVLTMGLGFNMAATAAYLVVATLFAAQLYASQSPGFELPWPNLIMVVIMSCVVSLGTSAMPSAGFLLLTTTFAVAGLPPGALVATGLIFAVDWFVDRVRAVVNVCGDAIGAATVADVAEQMRAAGRTAHVRHQIGRDRPGRPTSDNRDDRYAARRGGRGGRVDQPRSGRERSERPERIGRPDRPDRSDRPDRDRTDRGDRRPGSRPRFDERPTDRPERSKPSPFDMPVSTTPVLDVTANVDTDSVKPDRPEPITQQDRQEQRNLPERAERGGRPDRADRPDRPERGDRRDRPDRPDRRGRGRFGDRDRHPRSDRGDRSDSRSERPSREEMERELANVSAQIGDEEGPGPTTQSQMESPMTSEPIQASEPAPAEPTREVTETQRSVTRRFDMRELEAQEKPADQPAPERKDNVPLRERDELTAAETEQASEAEHHSEWGRGVKRHGKLPASGSEETTPERPTNAPEPQSSFTSENLEFGGRGRKKRPNA